MDKDLRAYLHSSAGRELLRGCASSLQSWMKQNSIPRSVLPFDEEDDLVSEIVLFILERESLRQEMEDAVEGGTAHAMRSLIVFSFKRHLQDMRRASQGSAWHAQYRKIARILSRQPGFLWQGMKEGSFYALAGESKMEPARPRASGMRDFDQWLHPRWDPKADLETNIVQAAQDFWREVTSRNGAAAFLPLRDLFAYLAAKGVVDVQSKEVMLESDFPEDALETFENLSVTPFCPPLEEEALVALAERIVSAWDAAMAQAFFLVHAEEKTQEEAARIMGYKAASGVNYVLRQAVLNLKEMVAAWTELFGPEESEREQAVFLRHVLKCCGQRAGEWR